MCSLLKKSEWIFISWISWFLLNGCHYVLNIIFSSSTLFLQENIFEQSNLISIQSLNLKKNPWKIINCMMRNSMKFDQQIFHINYNTPQTYNRKKSTNHFLLNSWHFYGHEHDLNLINYFLLSAPATKTKYTNHEHKKRRERLYIQAIKHFINRLDEISSHLITIHQTNEIGCTNNFYKWTNFFLLPVFYFVGWGFVYWFNFFSHFYFFVCFLYPTTRVSDGI